MIDITTLYPDLSSILDDKVREISQAPKEELGPLCEEACVYYRTAGIASFLLELDVECFHQMLVRSGLTRVYLLRNVPEQEKVVSRYCKASRTNGFLDAVASRQWNVARDIANLSPGHYIEQYEYEEDYCYALVLHQLVVGTGREVVGKTLERFTMVLDGQASVKLQIATALADLDQQNFEAAFLNLLEHRRAELISQERSISRDEVEFVTGRHVYVEGLAVLRLAEHLGMRVEAGYDFCPDELRVQVAYALPLDGYPQ